MPQHLDRYSNASGPLDTHSNASTLRHTLKCIRALWHIFKCIRALRHTLKCIRALTHTQMHQGKLRKKPHLDTHSNASGLIEAQATLRNTLKCIRANWGTESSYRYKHCNYAEKNEIYQGFAMIVISIVVWHPKKAHHSLYLHLYMK